MRSVEYEVHARVREQELNRILDQVGFPFEVVIQVADLIGNRVFDRVEGVVGTRVWDAVENHA